MYEVRQIPQAYRTASIGTTMIGSENQQKTINLRLHPIALVPMITSRDTKASFRADLDFILSPKVTLGPSVAFRRQSIWDDAALAGGAIAAKNENTLELGVLTNVYVSGTTSDGGFIVRPHVYWVEVKGSRSDDKGSVVTATHKPGWRAGAEVLYQKILQSGLNFEVGGGFTYHLAPYAVDYTGGATSAPDSRLAPTISAGIGWAW